MAGPWEKYAAQQTQPTATPQPEAMPNANPAAKYAPNEAPVWEGSILPVSKDAGGNAHFDSNAGLLGQVKRAFMAPGDAYTGQLQVMGPDGNVTPEAIQRAGEFASVFSPMNPGVRAGDMIVPGAKTTLKAVDIEPPTAEELKAAGSAGYDRVRGLDARYSSQSVSDMANAIAQSLEADGFNATTAPNTFKNLHSLQNPPASSYATSDNLETARRTFGKIGQDFSNPTDQSAGKSVRGAIDSFVVSPADGAVLPGFEEAASRAATEVTDARGNIAASKRSGSLMGLQDAAELRAGAANSGLNVGNSIRQRAASLILDPKQASGFTADELSAIREVAQGTAAQNVTRFVGNLLGGGGGLGTALTGTGGAALGGFAGGGAGAATIGAAALPLAGVASKQISNVMTKKALEAVDASTRMRSPLAQALMDAAPKEAQLPTKTAALLRALLLSQNPNNGGGGGF